MLLSKVARLVPRNSFAWVPRFNRTSRLQSSTIHSNLLTQPRTVMTDSQSSPGGANGPQEAATSKLKRSASDSLQPTKKQKTSREEDHQHLDYTHVPSDWLDASTQNDHGRLHLTYHTGNMFADAPKGCVLVHACNTQGHWGAGIAKTFRELYPKAYAAHHKFCKKDHSKSQPVQTGTAQLLAPCDDDSEHWIGCVFTSAKYGKGKDKPDQIVKNTEKSMRMLLQMISQVDDKISKIRMCKINSGKFGVPWEQTEDIIKGIVLKQHWPTKIEVWEPAE